MLNLSINRYWHDVFSRIAKTENAEAKNKLIHNFFEEVLKPGRLRKLLEDFICVITNLAEQQQYSYFHDNGFHKITLYVDMENLMKLRLHIWDPISGKRAPQNVHNHRWSYTSAILLGEMVQKILRVSDGDGECYHYKYSARGTKSYYNVHSVGRCSVEVYQTDRLTPGMIYSLPFNVLHQIDVPSDQTVATLILTHETDDLVVNDLISSRRLDVVEGKIASPPYSNEFLIELVRQFMHVRQLKGYD